jgi:hypothetical protein
MKRILYGAIVLLLIAGDGYAECNCRQPFYKDMIDLLTRYTACLERCYNQQIETLTHRIDGHEKTILELEAGNVRLEERIREIEKALTVKTKD